MQHTVNAIHILSDVLQAIYLKQCFLQGDAFVSIYRSHPDLYTTEDFVTYR